MGRRRRDGGLACGYGLLKAGSIWYPINLLAAVVYAQSVNFGSADLNAFHLDSFAIAVGVHASVSTLVGLLYGAMLPMVPRRPMVLGGLIVPVLWSGLMHSTMSLLNPLLASRIDWVWFVASQVAFGIVAGAVVVRRSPMPTLENVSFALRAGIEAPGTISPREGNARDARSTSLCADDSRGYAGRAVCRLRHSARSASRQSRSHRHPTTLSSLRPCMAATAPVATALTVEGAPQSRSPILCTSRSWTTLDARRHR